MKELESKQQAVQSDIYKEENLFTGSTEETEAKKEFLPWFKVKIEGKVSSYKLHSDNSLQLKFQQLVEKESSGVKFTDIDDKSIRIRKDSGSYTDKEAKNLLGKVVEVINVNESPVYAKNHDDSYNYNKVERYIYSANNVKVIEKSIPRGFELFKIIEFKVKEIIPALKYDQRQRKQIIEKNSSVLIYENTEETLTNLHKITCKGLSYNNALELKNQEVVILDLTIIGKNYFCSKIKLKG